MIKVLQVFGRLDRGGAETIIMNYYRNIDRKKIQFDFIVHTEEECAYENEIKSLGGNVYRMPRFKLYNYLQYRSEWKKFLKNNNQYKAIHAHMITSAAEYFPIAKEMGIKTIAHSHNTQDGNGVEALLKKAMHKRLSKSVNHYFACSEEAGFARFGRDIMEHNDVTVLKNAINAKHLEYNVEIRSAKREELGIKRNDIVIGHIGRFGEVKNHSFLINIFEKLHSQNNNMKLLLIGTGELEGKIKDLVIKKGLKHVVSFLGSRDDVPQLLQAMDCFVFPSLFEGLPVTLVEAQASGLPCLISDKITKKVVVTDLIRYASLNDSSDQWAMNVLNLIESSERKSTYNNILRSGYDVESQSKWLQDFYITTLK